MLDTIDHREIISSLNQSQKAELTARSDLPALLRLLAHGGLMVVLGAAIAAKVPFWPALLLPHGILLIFLFTPLHETIHETAFRTPIANRLAAMVCGFLVFIPPLWFRYFHFAHHRHTHHPDHDPELQQPKPRTVWQYIVTLSGIPFWLSMARVIISNALRANHETFVPQKAHKKVTVEARFYLAAYLLVAAVSLLAGSDAIIWLWIAPALIGQPFLRAYLLAEHTLCPHVVNMLENTRTTFTNNIVRFIAWNMPYHAEHHAYPAVPFHKLPDFHKHVRAHLAETERGYVRFQSRLLKTFPQ